MSRSQKVFAVAWLALVAVSLWGRGLPQFAASDPLGLPADLQQWQHTRTLASGSGYHEMYVNPIGTKASEQRGIYPDGAKLVQVVYGSDRMPVKYAIMLKDNQLFYKTGGWGFSSFATDGSRQPLNAEEDCWSCHSKQDRTDHVFSSPFQ